MGDTRYLPGFSLGGGGILRSCATDCSVSCYILFPPFRRSVFTTVPALLPAEVSVSLEPAVQRPRTLVDILSQRVRETPQQTAFVFAELRESEEIGYRRLWDRAAELAELVRAHTAPGDRVMLLCPPGPDFVYAFFACMITRRIPVAAHLPMSVRQLATLTAIIQDSGAVAALAPLTALPVTKELLGVDIRIVDIDSAAAASGAELASEQFPGPDDIAFLQYTSGSTGTPKGVTVLHRNLIHNLGLIQAKNEFGSHNSIVSWLPPYHDMGLIQGVLMPVFLGCRATLMSPMTFLRDPLTWLRAISGAADVIAGGPNLAYSLPLKRVSAPDAAALDLSGWRLAFVGAEPVDPAVLRRFSDAFAPSGFRQESFTPMYGLAESTLYVNGGPPGAGPRSRCFSTDELERGVAIPHSHGRELLSVGPVADGLAVVDPGTRIRCGENKIGEVWLRGESIAAGYWNKETETERAFHATIAGEDGPRYLRTGDLGFVCAGELYISGRIKELMIVHGRNIFPQDIERTILAHHPALRPGGCAVFAAAVDDEDRVMVVQEVNETLEHAQEQDLALSIREIVSRVHAINLHRIVFVGKGQVPKTTSGKIQRQRLRAEYSSPAQLQESVR
ncbi:fatty acyl-AMP ligase [Nocardia huaxiensis]|uniref:Fatty acyl-AMP ligase n=1 Tax=Nocardia huaxiensis TaxID=2755382 RepID=A0A7D6Z2I5_9NOCA|nr:fatty acyl-AMP ligase [Nocardia huaxiensis]QLY29244.1 fatty acyl-AMP ligase [Nocardia huaxiensis]UFS97255.1 fatty acyl-AMP ligase [Nocardia huaxiensis]